MENKKDTSWKKVAEWYDKTVKDDDSYQKKVIAPNLFRWLQDAKGKKIIDVGCGQGFFSRELADRGADVTGVDSAGSLLEIARKGSGAINTPHTLSGETLRSVSFFAKATKDAFPRSSNDIAKEGKKVKYIKAEAQNLSFAKAGEFDIALCVLSLQNMENLKSALGEISRVLKPGGKLIAVLNHPVFRIPQGSSWDFDGEKNIQYRRIDSYLSSSKSKIDMHPSEKTKKVYTYSFHHSLQDYFKALAGSSFAVVKLEEWISHRKSEAGPHAKAEDISRKEIPLFLAFEAVKV